MKNNRVLTIYLSETKINDLLTAKKSSGKMGTVSRNQILDEIEKYLDGGKLQDAIKIDNRTRNFPNNISQKSVIYKFVLKPNLQYDIIEFVAKKDKITNGDKMYFDDLVKYGQKVRFTKESNSKLYKKFAAVVLAAGTIFGAVKFTPEVLAMWNNHVIDENYENLYETYDQINDSIEEYYSQNPLSNMNRFGIVYHNPDEEREIEVYYHEYLSQQQIDPRAKDLWKKFEVAVNEERQENFSREEKQILFDYEQIQRNAYEYGANIVNPLPSKQR